MSDSNNPNRPQDPIHEVSPSPLEVWEAVINKAEYNLESLNTEELHALKIREACLNHCDIIHNVIVLEELDDITRRKYLHSFDISIKILQELGVEPKAELDRKSQEEYRDPEVAARYVGGQLVSPAVINICRNPMSLSAARAAYDANVQIIKDIDLAVVALEIEQAKADNGGILDLLLEKKQREIQERNVTVEALEINEMTKVVLNSITLPIIVARVYFSLAEELGRPDLHNKS